MRSLKRTSLLACLIAIPCGFASQDDDLNIGISFSQAEIKRILQHELGAVPADPTNRVADHPGAAHLGQFLFFEKRFSANGEISCATCHDPETDFVEGASLATGLQPLARHTQSLWNVAYNRWFFWDGRADTLWAQALDPFENDKEFGSNRMKIAHIVARDPQLRQAYEKVFGPMPAFESRERFPSDARPVSGQPNHPHQAAWDLLSKDDQAAVNQVFANIGKAIAAYERKLIARDSPFDRFVEGLKNNDPAKMAALPIAAQRGLKLFIGDANCRLCHTGPNFTDGEFHNNGVPVDRSLPPDAGRFEGIGLLKGNVFNAIGPLSDDLSNQVALKTKSLINSAETWGQFKTPGLRNVGRTAPYMHHGQFETLREALDFYSTLEGQVLIGHHQETLLKPVGLSEQQIADLEAFLESLSCAPVAPELTIQPDSPVPP